MTRAIIMLVILASGACQQLETPPQALVGILGRDRIEIIAESNDPLVALYFAEGAGVRSGDVIVQQDTALSLSRLDQLLAGRDRLRFYLAELERGPRPEAITAARARLEGFINEIKIQKREYQRVSQLVEQQLATPSSLDRVLALQQQAEANRDQVGAELDSLLAGTTREELDQARSALAEAEAGLNTQRLLLDRLSLTSPVDGTLEHLYYELGERPVTGTTVAVILANTSAYARVYIPETLRSKILPGQAAEIRIDGFATIFPGKVRYISSEAAFTPYYALTLHDRSRLSYLAEIDISIDDGVSLPNGVPLEVSFSSLKQNPGD